MGEGSSYRELQKGRVQCRDFREEMALVSVAGHNMTQHGQASEARHIWKTLATGEEPRTCRMAFPAMGGPRSCPVEGCPVRAATRTAMRVHFLYRHVLDNVVILEEGNLPPQRCYICNMLVLRQALNSRHPATAQRARGEELKRRRLTEAELRESLERAFEAYGEPLENVTVFIYLGWVLTV